MHSIAQNRKSNMNRLDSNIKRVVKIVRGISFRVSSTRKLGSFRCYISPFRHGDFRSFFKNQTSDTLYLLGYLFTECYESQRARDKELKNCTIQG